MLSEFDALRAACRATVGFAGGPQGTNPTQSAAQTLANLLAKARLVGSQTDFQNLLREIGIDPSNDWATNGIASESSV